MRLLAVFALALMAAPTAARAQCAAGDGPVTINEFIANPVAGSDNGEEWVELYNSSGTAVDIDGWKLQRMGSSGGGWIDVYTVPAASADVPANGWLLIADKDYTYGGGAPLLQLPDGLATTDNLTLGSGASGDAVRLLNDTAQVVDTVAYGTSSNSDMVPDDCDNPSVNVVATAPEGMANARVPDGEDTDVSTADFSEETPTPGAANPAPVVCAASIKINEFLPDQPTTEDQNLEWVELYNPTGSTVALTDWVLEYQGSAKYDFTASDSIAAGGFFLIGESAVTPKDAEATLAMGSGGAGGDQLQLLDCNDEVIDTVVYGSGNTEEHLDDSGAIATSIAPDPSDGDAIARIADGADTNLSGDDFWLAITPSPGASNPAPPVCNAGGTVVINEFSPDQPGSEDQDLEWIELYNAGGTTADLGGWTLRYGSTPGNVASVYTFGEGDDIVADEYLLIGEAAVTDRDFTAVLGMGSGGVGGDVVMLVDCDGMVVDTVIYGSGNDDMHLDDNDVIATSVAPDPGDGEVLARRTNGGDSDDSGADFFIADTPTPGAANPAPPVCVADPGGIVINEFLSNPSGSDSEVLLEWVELYNSGSAAATLDAWQIATATADVSYSVKVSFPAGTTLAAGDHLLVGEANVSNTDVALSIDDTLGIGTGLRADGVRLIDCTGATVDTVVFGDELNEDAVVDDSGVAATSVAPAPGDDASLARRVDGVDTDLSADDFTVSGDPTPGAANPMIVCTPSVGDVLINEFLPDPAGSDGEALAEWIELYNSGSAPVDIDGWQIIAAGGPDDVSPDIILPPQTTIASEGFFVIGAEMVAEADYMATFSIGNGSGGDALRLVDCDGALVDVVVYGNDNDNLNTDESGAVADPVDNPSSDQSLARVDDGVDSDSPDDWFADVTPSPGATNFQEIPDCPDCEQGGGCRGNAPDNGEAPGGCASNSDGPPGEGGCVTAAIPLGGFELVVGLLVAVARRRA